MCGSRKTAYTLEENTDAEGMYVHHLAGIGKAQWSPAKLPGNAPCPIPRTLQVAWSVKVGWSPVDRETAPKRRPKDGLHVRPRDGLHVAEYLTNVVSALLEQGRIDLSFR